MNYPSSLQLLISLSDHLRFYERSSSTFELSALKTTQIFAKVINAAEILTRLFVQRGQTQKKITA